MEKLPQVVSDPEMIIMSDDENVSDEEVCPVEPTPRENLNTDDVFSKSSKKKVTIDEGVPVVQKVKTETKKGKARKPLSEEHKEKLKVARQLGCGRQSILRKNPTCSFIRHARPESSQIRLVMYT